jgi:arylsulfatase A-like enzyme
MNGKSVRTFRHKGHEISITTMYQVKIDRRVVHLPLMVSDDGHVQSHAIPNYSLSSAVDIVKTIVDLFPEDFEKKKSRGRRAGGQHGGHSQGHHH